MGSKKFESKANVVQKIFGPEIFSLKKLESNQILSKKNKVWQAIWSKKIGSKKVWIKKIFGSFKPIFKV